MAFDNGRAGLTNVSYGFIANPTAGNTYLLPRRSSNSGSSTGYICPSSGRLVAISIAVDNILAEWTAGSLEFDIQRASPPGLVAQVYTTGALLRAASTQVLRPDAGTEGYFQYDLNIPVSRGDVLFTRMIAGGTYAGGQDGPCIDLAIDYAS